MLEKVMSCMFAYSGWGIQFLQNSTGVSSTVVNFVQHPLKFRVRFYFLQNSHNFRVRVLSSYVLTKPTQYSGTAIIYYRTHTSFGYGIIFFQNPHNFSGTV